MTDEAGSSSMVEERAQEWDDNVTHSWCCDENVAWCGADVSESPEVAPDDPTDCPFCDLMEREPCPSGCNPPVRGASVSFVIYDEAAVLFGKGSLDA